jgi:ketopantoate hydroxymethyltransferase
LVEAGAKGVKAEGGRELCRWKRRSLTKVFPFSYIGMLPQRVKEEVDTE